MGIYIQNICGVNKATITRNDSKNCMVKSVNVILYSFQISGVLGLAFRPCLIEVKKEKIKRVLLARTS